MENSPKNSKENLLVYSFIDPLVFFKEKITDAKNKMNIKVPENVEYYLVQLLCQFISNAEIREDCLALILKKALESELQERIVLYKKIADIALYYSGFFQDSFVRKTYDVKYYTQMGENAFYELSVLMKKNSTPQKTWSVIYSEMAKNFLVSVDILLYISEKSFEHTRENERSLLSIYDAWVQTESKKLFLDLSAKGILPVKADRKKIQ